MKQKRFSKMMSILLVMAMLFTMMPATAWADGTDLPVSSGTVDIVDDTVGTYNLNALSVYLQGSYEPVSILSGTQDGNVIDIVLAEDTDPSATLQAGFAGSGTPTISHSGNKCTLNNGTGQMTCKVTQMANSKTYTINFSVPMGDAYEISLPSGVGYTVSGATTAYAGKAYSFTVNVNEGYDAAAMKVFANGEEVTGANGTYTIAEVNGNVEITVTGIVKKASYTVTLPTGEGYTVTGAASVYAGDDYTFKVAVDSAYKADSMTVKVNDVPVEENNGTYTVETVQDYLVITVEGIVAKAVYAVSLPEGEGYTAAGAATVYEGDTYIFTVTVQDGYEASGMIVKANDIALSGTNGRYTVEGLTGDAVITVEGLTKKEVYTVTVPSGKGFTFTGAEQVYEGDTYTFKVSAKTGFVVTVKVNGKQITGTTDGSYTVEAVAENLIITVDVQRAPLPEKELPVNGNVIDITDKTIYTYFGDRYYAKVHDIKIDGVEVSGAYEDGTTVYIVMPYTTEDDAKINVSFGNTVSSCTMSGHTAAITLEDGEYDLEMKVTGKYSGSRSGTVAYTLIFIREEAPTEPPVCVKNTDTAEVWNYRSLEINLKDYFTGAEQFYLADGENLTPIDGKTYHFVPKRAGEHVLVFSASNIFGMSQEQFTLTVTVKDVEGGIYIGHTTSNGAIDSVTFRDADGNLIDDLDISYENKVITVTLPKTYPVNGTVKATFGLTQTSGLPFITTSNSATGSGSAASKKFTETTTSLTGGAATLTFYCYNSTPKATSNSYETFKLVYKMANDLPVLADGQAPSVDAEMTAGESYRFDLSKIFFDADEDVLTYFVSENGGAAASAVVDEEGYYSFTTNEAGTYTLVFTANDGKGTSAETYTVNLTVKNAESTYSMTVTAPEGVIPVFTTSDGSALRAESAAAAAGLTVWTVSYPTNAQSMIASADGWGSVEFETEENGTVQLRTVKVAAADFAEEPVAASAAVSHNGETVTGGAKNQFILVVGETYTYTVNPEDSNKYASANVTEELTAGAELLNITVYTGYKNAFEFTVPTGGEGRMYKYNQYYSFTESQALASRDNENGTTTFYFNADTKDGNWVYRASMDGKITKSGYVAWGKQSLNITWTESDPLPTDRIDYQATSQENKDVAEDGVMLNINGQNNLSMAAGESRTLKAYRVWEIIPVSYNNYIITPDFHFNILSGEDVISLTEKESPSAGEGDWKTLTALKDGTAIIEVTCDAIQIDGGNYDGLHGASDPTRTGLAVIQVGGHDSSVDFGIESKASQGSTVYKASNSKAWDAEFDTLYFTGNSGKLNLTPKASGTITKVEVSGDKGTTWTQLSSADGTYTADIVAGNNIIRVTTDKGTAYQVVRGDKITVRYVEVDEKSDKDEIIEAGETIRIYLEGLHQPIPKMAGNYNPSYSGNTDGDSVARIRYTFNGTTVQNNGQHQYNFINVGNYVEITVPEAAEGTVYTLTDGYIGVGVIGLKTFADGGDSHRNIPDGGCATRGSDSTFHTRSMMPELTITVGQSTDSNNAPTPAPGAVTEASVEAGKNYAVNPDTLFNDRDGGTLRFTVSVNGGEAVEVKSDYKFRAETEGTYTLKFTASDGKAAAEHTITVTVTKKEELPEEPTGPKFDLTENQIKGYVTVSFEDFAERVEGEKGLKYPTPLGVIVPATQVPYTEGDTIADVTLRLLRAYGIGAEYSGTTKSGFYLGAIKNFEVDNTPYSTMGEFDAGSGSGWMITHNGIFIDQGASQFKVGNGDVIQWQYTCQLGKDIGDPFYDMEGETEEEVKEVTSGGAGTDGSAATTTTPTEVAVSGTTAVATITKENTAETLKQASENKSEEIIVQVAAADTKGAENVKVELNTDTVKDIVEDTEAALTVKTENGTVTLDRETLKTVAAEAAGETVTLEVIEVAAPTAEQKEAAGENGHVIQLVIKSGDKVISDFNKGKATVTVAVPDQLKGKRLAAIHIGDDGTVEQLNGREVTVNGKKHYRFETPHFSAFALVDADELGLEVEEEALSVNVKGLLAELTPVVRSEKNSKANIKVTLKLGKTDKAIIQQLEEAGFTVKYNFYRSTKKASKYTSMLMKDTTTYTNTKGKKGKTYYYKARVQVYDAEGKLIARTALKQCKYAKRVWTK